MKPALLSSEISTRPSSVRSRTVSTRHTDIHAVWLVLAYLDCAGADVETIVAIVAVIYIVGFATSTALCIYYTDDPHHKDLESAFCDISLGLLFLPVLIAGLALAENAGQSSATQSQWHPVPMSLQG